MKLLEHLQRRKNIYKLFRQKIGSRRAHLSDLQGERKKVSQRTMRKKKKEQREEENIKKKKKSHTPKKKKKLEWDQVKIEIIVLLQ